MFVQIEIKCSYLCFYAANYRLGCKGYKSMFQSRLLTYQKISI